MLDLPEITVDDFETQMEKFINHASLYNSSWNMQGEHSIGVILAELFVFLKVTQQENMNKITPESLLRICKLAGGYPSPLIPATSLISVTGTGNMLPGTKLTYSGIVFEITENIHLMNNSITKISYLDGDVISLHNYITSGNINIKLFDKHDNFVLGFENPIETGVRAQIYILTDDNNRTPVTDKESLLNAIGRNNLKWQYYGVEDETEGWHDLEVISDDTLSLLCSGVISFSAKGLHCEKDGCYPIMCSLENDFYDIYPNLKQICLNAAGCRQTDTKCTKVTFTYKEFVNDSMYINNYLAETEIFKMFINTEFGYFLIDDPNISRSIIYENGAFRLTASDKNEMLDVFSGIEGLSDETDVVMLILYENNYYTEYTSDGTSNMKFKTNFTGVLESELSIMVGNYLDGGLYWEEWTYVPDLLYSGPDDKVFTFKGDTIVTGDNKNGKIPAKSFDGTSKNIIISSLVLSAGEKGNIPAGAFECTALTAETYEIIRINDSVNGKNRELPQDVLANILQIRTQGTLVTKNDFINAATGTEGLIIDKVICELPVDENGETEPNAVDIRIYPGRECRPAKRLEWYKKAVSNRLMKYKPLTLKMNITIEQNEDLT